MLGPATERRSFDAAAQRLVRCALCPAQAHRGEFDQAVFRATGMWVCGACMEEELEALPTDETRHGF